MPSIYDVPAESNIVNTYVPIPFEEIVQAGTARQQRYEQGLAGLEQTQAEAELLRGMPGYDEQYIKEQVIPTINEITEKYINKDLSDPMIAKQISKELRTKVSKGNISKIQESYKNYQSYLNTLAKMGAAGRTPVPELLTDPSRHSTLKSGVFAAIPEAALDIETQSAEYFKNLGSQLLGPAFEIDPVTGTRAYRQGIVESMISGRAEESISNFLKTPEGNQLVRIQRARGDQRSAEDIAYEELYRSGMGFVGSNVGLIPGSGGKKQGPIFPTVEREVQLPAQEVPKERRVPRLFMKGIEKQQEELANLQYQINTSSPTIRAEKQAEYDQLAEKLNKDIAVLDQAVSVVNTEVNEGYRTALDDLKIDLLSKGISGEVFDNIVENIDSFIIKDISQRNVSPTYIYESIYGDKPHSSYSEKLAINEAVTKYNKYISNLENNVNKRTKEILKVSLPASLKESVTDAPPIVISQGVGYIIDPVSGKQIPSDIARIFKDVTTLVKDQKVEWIAGEKDDKLKKFQEADDYYIMGPSISITSKGPFLAVETMDVKKNKDGIKTSKPKATYKVFLPNQSDIQSVVRDFSILGYTKTARRWDYPNVSLDIEKGWNNPKDVKEGYNFKVELSKHKIVGDKYVPLPKTAYVTVVKRGNGYKLLDPDTKEESKRTYTTREDLEKAIYDMRVINKYSPV